MPSRAREEQLLDAMWQRVAPLIPKHRAHPKGGRPFADDRACFAGIVYQLRNVICWRRFDLWTRKKVWPKAWAIVLEELQSAGRLDASELFLDATFAESRKG